MMSYTIEEIKIMVEAGATHFDPTNDSYKLLLAKIDQLTAENKTECDNSISSK